MRRNFGISEKERAKHKRRKKLQREARDALERRASEGSAAHTRLMSEAGAASYRQPSAIPAAVEPQVQTEEAAEVPRQKRGGLFGWIFGRWQ